MSPGSRQSAAARAAARSRKYRTRAAVPNHAGEAAGSSHHRFETEWLTHPVLALTPLRQIQTSKAKFKLQTEVTQVLVVQSSFPRKLGDAIRKPHVLKDRKPPSICSRSAHTALTDVTEPSTRSPLRPRSGCAAFVPARPPVPAERLCLSQPRGPHCFLRRAPAPPPPASGRAPHLPRPPTPPARRVGPHPGAPEDSRPGSPPLHGCPPPNPTRRATPGCRSGAPRRAPIPGAPKSQPGPPHLISTGTRSADRTPVTCLQTITNSPACPRPGPPSRPVPQARSGAPPDAGRVKGGARGLPASGVQPCCTEPRDALRSARGSFIALARPPPKSPSRPRPRCSPGWGRRKRRLGGWRPLLPGLGPRGARGAAVRCGRWFCTVGAAAARGSVGRRHHHRLETAPASGRVRGLRRRGSGGGRRRGGEEKRRLGQLVQLHTPHFAQLPPPPVRPFAAPTARLPQQPRSCRGRAARLEGPSAAARFGARRPGARESRGRGAIPRRRRHFLSRATFARPLRGREGAGRVQGAGGRAGAAPLA